MPSTTWDAAFKVHTPVERYIGMMPAAAMPAWDKAFRVC